MGNCIIEGCPEEGTREIKVLLERLPNEELPMKVCEKHYEILNKEFHRGYIDGIEEALMENGGG